MKSLNKENKNENQFGNKFVFVEVTISDSQGDGSSNCDSSLQDIETDLTNKDSRDQQLVVATSQVDVHKDSVC